jgi:hypothetical protein
MSQVLQMEDEEGQVHYDLNSSTNKRLLLFD